MSKARGPNLAVTVDGAKYNKLTRPDDWNSPPITKPTGSANSEVYKRKRDDEIDTESPDRGPKRGKAQHYHMSGDGDLESHNESDNDAHLHFNQFQDRKRGHNTGKADPNTGQKSFICVTDTDDMSDDYTREAMEYLRTVRQEADNIPHLLVAPVEPTDEGEYDPSIYDTGYGDSRGYYSDGAYVAAPVAGPTLPKPSYLSGEGDHDSSLFTCNTIEPQQAYFARLHNLFLTQRSTLHSNPPLSAVRALRPDQYITFPAQSSEAFKVWKDTINTSDPSPAQLASMHTDTVLRLLQFITSQLKRKKNIEKRTSSWIWGLLGCLAEVGTLSTEEVGMVRELGKKAVWVKCGFMEAQIAEATEPFGEEEEASKPPAVLKQDDHQLPDDNTNATLDMIIGIVGELYGQRDLLEFRECWGKAEPL